jgi:hypothetical protein
MKKRNAIVCAAGAAAMAIGSTAAGQPGGASPGELPSLDPGSCCEEGTDCCAPVNPEGAPQPVAVIDSLDPLREAFNANADKPRVLLLVSPLCSECVLGAEAVRKSILDQFAESGVFAIVVWEPMVPPDTEEAALAASGIFADAPAVQFYDPERLAGWAFETDHFSNKWDEVDAALPDDHWLRETVDSKPEPAPEWDVYMVYRPGVLWEDETPKPDAFIRHIGRGSDGLSHFWRDAFNSPPAAGDLFEAMETMGGDILEPEGAMRIELLGFPDCPNTPVLRENLRAALASIGEGITFRDVNQAELAEDDVRRGWPTPTILVNGVDLFNLPAPTGTAMSCRGYADGIPSSDAIRARMTGRQ